MSERDIDPPDSKPDLSRAERETIGMLLFNQRSLGSYADDFHNALALFEYCSKHQVTLQRDPNMEPVQIWRSWLLVAARDGAMSIYHFGKCIDAIQSLFRLCPSFNDKVDHTKIRIAKKLFRSRFPFFVRLRHAIAHSAERAQSPLAFERHATKGAMKLADGSEFGGRGVVMHIGSGLTGRIFFATQEGVLVSYSVDENTLRTLFRATSLIYSAVSNPQEEAPASSKPSASSGPLPLP
jgi:hypothetical protein